MKPWQVKLIIMGMIALLVLLVVLSVGCGRKSKEKNSIYKCQRVCVGGSLYDYCSNGAESFHRYTYKRCQ